jgi:hypothetical protein
VFREAKHCTPFSGFFEKKKSVARVSSVCLLLSHASVLPVCFVTASVLLASTGERPQLLVG